MTLYSGTLNIDRAVAGHRRLSPETQTVLDAGRKVETLLDLVEFAASAHVPLFNVLPWGPLSAEQFSIIAAGCRS